MAQETVELVQSDEEGDEAYVNYTYFLLQLTVFSSQVDIQILPKPTRSFQKFSVVQPKIFYEDFRKLPKAIEAHPRIFENDPKIFSNELL